MALQEVTFDPAVTGTLRELMRLVDESRSIAFFDLRKLSPEGRVTSVKDFGAFVEIIPGKDGLCHISELADFRVKRVEDVVKVGDMIHVKCIGVDERGKIKLSRRAAMKATFFASRAACRWK